MKQVYKYPRLYLNAPLGQNAQISLETAQAHYLRNVLRRDVGDMVRVFNGRDGEWLARIDDLGKKNGVLSAQEMLRAQPAQRRSLALYFAPIKKQRMDILIEKAVELGATDLYPVLTNRTENRKISIEKIMAQVIEAAEQCERMDVPRVHEARGLHAAIKGREGVIYAAIERAQVQDLADCRMDGDVAFLIGPEGGFDSGEIEMISGASNVCAVSLGAHVLRAETAALACLSYAYLSTDENISEKKR